MASGAPRTALFRRLITIVSGILACVFVGRRRGLMPMASDGRLTIGNAAVARFAIQ